MKRPGTVQLKGAAQHDIPSKTRSGTIQLNRATQHDIPSMTHPGTIQLKGATRLGKVRLGSQVELETDQLIQPSDLED